MSQIADIIWVSQPVDYEFHSVSGSGTDDGIFLETGDWVSYVNWNHAGTQVAGFNGSGELVLIDVGHGESTVLSNVPASIKVAGGVDFTADDSKIIAVYDNGSTAAGLTFIHVDGSSHSEVSLGASGTSTIVGDFFSSVGASPDGTKVAYMTKSGSVYSLKVCNVGGTGITTVFTDGTKSAYLCDWFSDSSHILMLVWHDPSFGKGTLYKTNLSGTKTSIFADTGGSVLITNSQSAALSPDNTKIALWNASSASIETMAAAGGARTTIYGPDTDSEERIDWGSSFFTGAGIAPPSIGSGEAFGVASMLGRGSDRLVLPSAIASLEAFGSPTLSAGTTTISPVGIPAP